MNKKIIISIVIVFIVMVLGFGIWNLKFRNNSVTENDNQNNLTNNVDISKEYIIDDCVNEWSDYAKYIQDNVELANNNIYDENTRYLVKDINGYIYVYYIDNENNEILYKKTEISTEYLSIGDLDDLEIGIEVVGSKQLNQLLEDFE
ncbi:MAG: hypothetical protein HFJ17_06015 [Clostridia bacterium]|nr:hypothetical protein [Clostridia bacterium]